jgi:hypothetical protein
MKRSRIALIAATGALLAAGTGAAVGATSSDEAKKAEDAVLADAAKRLDTTAQKLRDALKAAQDAQLAQAVKDGRLTQEQADAIKQRRDQSGRVLGGPGRHGGPGGRGFGGPGRGGGRALMADLAKAIGISESSLHSQLHDGKTLAAIAKAKGKTVAEVTKAAKAAAKTRLDKQVAAKEITQAQADGILEHIGEHLDALASGQRLRRGPGRHHGPKPTPGDSASGGNENGSTTAPPVASQDA